MKKIDAAVHEVVHAVMDFLYPPACLVCCGSVPGRDLICHSCVRTITDYSYQYNPSHRTVTYVDTLSILLPYNYECRRLVHALKYHGMHSIGVVLGNLMARKTLKKFPLPENTCLVPVPLHPSKLNDRGYNQSERLAEGFASFTGHKIMTDLLVRKRNTGTQTSLDHHERVLNVRDAFHYTGEKLLSGRPTVLIDDVMTTGSTISQCAKALKEGGAGKITVAVVATPGIRIN